MPQFWSEEESNAIIEISSAKWYSTYDGSIFNLILSLKSVKKTAQKSGKYFEYVKLPSVVSEWKEECG